MITAATQTPLQEFSSSVPCPETPGSIGSRNINFSLLSVLTSDCIGVAGKAEPAAGQPCLPRRQQQQRWESDGTALFLQPLQTQGNPPGLNSIARHLHSYPAGKATARARRSSFPDFLIESEMLH